MKNALRITAVLTALLCASLPASAQTVTVCTGAYELPLEGELSAERAAMVAERLASGASQQAIAKLEVANCRCSQPNCLAGLVTNERPILLAATVRDMAGDYQVVVFDDTGAARTATVTGPFDDLLAKLDELAVGLLRARMPSPPASTEVSALQTDVGASKGRKRIEPTAFWISTASTAALGVAYGVTEALIITRSASLESDLPSERSQAEWNSLKNLQIADRIIFATMLTAAATTVVLSIFTRFKKEPKDQHKTKVSLGLLGVQGSF